MKYIISAILVLLAALSVEASIPFAAACVAAALILTGRHGAASRTS